MKKRIVVIALALSATLLLADNSQYKYEFTPMVGGVVPEGNLNLENQLTYGGSLGINLDKSMLFDQVELGYLRSSNVDYDNSNQDTNFNRYFVNLVKDYKINNKTSLYTLIGVGYEDITNEQFDNKSSGFFNYGVGLKYDLQDNLFLKADVRHMIKFSHSDNNLLYTVGLGIPFGKVAQPEPPKVAPLPKTIPVPPKDSDHDGVIDSLDKCPNTPAGAKVDKNGCPLDSDHDGVIDSLDKCPNTPAGLKVDKNGCPIEITLRLNFDTNKAVIKPEYAQKLQKYAKYLIKMQEQYKIEVKGYTDSTGSKKYNQKLSQRRAEAVVARLVQLGVKPSDIVAKGYGESDPIASNATKEGRYQNRRVVIDLEK